MPLFGERIVTKHPVRGLIALTAIAGSVWGVVVPGLIDGGPPRWMVGLAPFWTFLIVVSVWSFCPFLWLASWAMVMQRRRLHVAMGGIWFASVVISMELHTRSQQIAMGIDLPSQSSSGRLIVNTTALMVGLTLGALVVWLVRSFVVSLTEQSDPPRLCWRCGYDVGTSMPPTCPECGRSPARARPRWNWLHRSAMVTQRCARPAGALMICVLLVFVLRVYVLEVRPVREFCRRLGPESTIVYSYLSPPQDFFVSGSPPMYDPAIGRFLQNQTGAPHGYVVSYNPRPRYGLALMQIRIAVPPILIAGGAGNFAANGSRLIQADLTSEQAMSVIQSGIPPELLSALSRRAEDVQWNSAVNSNLREVVDPAPYFPVEKALTTGKSRTSS